MTEENVLELLREIEKDWRQDTIRGTSKTPDTHKNETLSKAAQKILDGCHVSSVYACGGYAAMVSSLIFGDTANPGRRLEELFQIRPGDIIFRVNNKTGRAVSDHAVPLLWKRKESVYILGCPHLLPD